LLDVCITHTLYSVLDRRVETLTESILQLYTAEIEECTDISEKTSSDVSVGLD